jgi:predicted ferric reductase
MLVVVALWVANRGVQNLGELGSGLTSLGRLAGLLSADLLLIQVLLMARLPIAERVYGQDELARRHRLVGFTSFNLLLVHLVLITFGYSVSSGQNVFLQVWDFVLNYPGMLLATAATALLVMVVVTSVKKARATLRYESWHLLHLYAYLGVGLSIPHEVWTGADFTSSTVAQVYWWSLYAAALGAVLIWRVGVPVYRSLRHQLVVHQVVQEAPGVVSVTVKGRQLHRLQASAGQFFTWRFMDGPGWSRAHPYSLSAAPSRNRLRITVKDLGDGSRSLAGLTRGARVLIEGPYGRLHAGVRTRRKVTLMASGIGVTPMRALLEELEQGPGDVTLIYRASSAADLVHRDELDALAARTGATVFYVVGPRLQGRPTWLPQAAQHLDDAQALRQLVPDLAEHDVYLCGAQEWMDAAAAAARACGVPSENIHLERFSW